MLNLLTFQLVTGNKQFYCMGVYIPPTDTMGVEDLWAAWEACPACCTPLVLGDLNINFRDPQNKWEELIINLLDNINIVDVSRRFIPQQPRKQSTRAQWTWRHKREGRMHHSQPDYILAREGNMRQFRGVRFWWRRYHDLDHQAVVATI
jgi:hypothetical protein